jgi:antitoxin VapB
MNKSDAVKMALENKLRRVEEASPVRERLRLLQERVLARAANRFEVDKAFYNEVSGNS